MNKVYHARIVWYHYLYLILLLAMLIVIFMEKLFILGGIYCFFLICVIDKIFNTAYTITPERTLIISKGWSSKKKAIPIVEIAFVEEMFKLKIAGIAVTKFILIKHNNKYYSLLPDKQVEFFESLTINEK